MNGSGTNVMRCQQNSLVAVLLPVACRQKGSFQENTHAHLAALLILVDVEFIKNSDRRLNLPRQRQAEPDRHGTLFASRQDRVSLHGIPVAVDCPFSPHDSQGLPTEYVCPLCRVPSAG